MGVVVIVLVGVLVTLDVAVELMVVLWDVVAEVVWDVVGVERQGIDSSAAESSINSVKSATFFPQSSDTVRLGEPLIRFRISRFGFAAVSIANLVIPG